MTMIQNVQSEKYGYTCFYIVINYHTFKTFFLIIRLFLKGQLHCIKCKLLFYTYMYKLKQMFITKATLLTNIESFNIQKNY